MATPEERIKALREEIQLKIQNNELDKFSREQYRKTLEDLDKRNASEGEYQQLLKNTKTQLDAVSRSADYVAQSFFDAVNDLTKTNKLLVEQRQNLNKLSRTARDLLDIRSGEAAVNEKVLKKKREEIRLGLRNLQFLKEAAKDDKEKQKELQNQINAVKELEGVYDSIQSTVNKTNRDLGAIPALAGGIDAALQKAGIPALGLADALEKTHMAAQEAEQIGGEAASSFDAMAEFAGNVKENLMEALTPANLIQFALVEIVSAMISLDQQAGEIAKNFGISYDQARGLQNEMTDAAASSYLLSITTKDLGETFVKINNEFGTFAAISEEALESFSRLTDEAKISDAAAMALYKTTFLTGKTLEESSSEVLGQVAAFNAMNGTAFNQKEIMEDIANLSAATTLSLGGSTDELAKAVLSAKALGIEVSKLEQIADGLLQFESSITNELEAELLIGRDLNLERARFLALNNDIAGVAEEIASQVGSAADFTKMNRIQQESLAKAVGMTRDGLADALMEREALAKLSGIEGDTAKERFNNLVKEVGLEEAKRRLGDENLANMYASENIQERFTQAVEKLKEIFVAVGEVLMPIVEVLGDAIGYIAKFVGALSPALKILTRIYLIFKGIQLIQKGFIATQKMINTIRAKGYMQAKAASTLEKVGLFTAKQRQFYEGRVTYFKNREKGLNKVNLGLENASLGNSIKRNVAKKASLLTSLKENAATLARNVMDKAGLALTASINTAKRIGVAISNLELGKKIASMFASIGNYAMTAAASAAATPVIGPVLAIAAMASAVAGGMALYSKFNKADDFMADGYGKRGYFDKDGITLLNNKDETFVAGTSLNKGKSMASSNAQQATQQAIANNELKRQNRLLERMANKNQDIYLGADKVGTAFAKNMSF